MVTIFYYDKYIIRVKFQLITDIQFKILEILLNSLTDKISLLFSFSPY